MDESDGENVNNEDDVEEVHSGVIDTEGDHYNNSENNENDVVEVEVEAFYRTHDQLLPLVFCPLYDSDYGEDNEEENDVSSFKSIEDEEPLQRAISQQRSENEILELIQLHPNYLQHTV